MARKWHTRSFLSSSGDAIQGDFSYEDESRIFLARSAHAAKHLSRSYFTENVPIEVHFHGIGHIDFSTNIEHLDLLAIQQFLSEEGILGIPTIFVSKSKLPHFLNLMQHFFLLKQEGTLPNILGLALEGPILLSNGGTPLEGSWTPMWQDWEKIAKCGPKGLKYMVISPDLNLNTLMPLAELFLSNGVYLSLGHLRKESVPEAIEGILAVTEVAKKMGFAPHSGVISIDHFLNDMPRNIKHAWRSVSERRMRSRQLIDIDVDSWKMNTLELQIGEVPALLIKLARKGIITLFLNFDGQHVDLHICRRLYEMVGADNIVAMTDRVETSTFGKAHLQKAEVGTLWYQKKGTVAAGSSTLDEQMTNMRALHIPERDIWKMCAQNAARIFKSNESSTLKNTFLSYIHSRNLRIGLEVNKSFTLK